MKSREQTKNKTDNFEIIAAILRGETVQHNSLYGGNEWYDFDVEKAKKDKSSFGPWNCCDAYQWRIKPKTTTFKFYQVIQHKVEIENRFIGEFESGKTYWTIHTGSVKPDKVYSCNGNTFNYGEDRLFFEKEEDAIKALNIINQAKGNQNANAST